MEIKLKEIKLIPKADYLGLGLFMVLLFWCFIQVGGTTNGYSWSPLCKNT